MKILLALFSFSLLAQGSSSEFIYSTGRASNLCDGSVYSSFCFDHIKTQSRRDAVQNAYYTCLNRKGQLESYSAICNDYCNPFFIQPDGPPQYVQCTSNCNTRCVIGN